MDKSPYLEKEAGVISKGVTRKSKGVTPRKLARIAIMPKNCALLQRIPHAHSRPQSPSFLGHVVGKRGALEAAVTGCQKISDIRSHVQKLQISLLMLITGFCPSLLHWGKNFTS